MAMIRPAFKPAPVIKPLFNIGACLDIPTGFYIIGIHGESILLGGLGMLTAIVGTGNVFKSTIEHYMMLSAAARISSTSETCMATYDTEINIHESRLRQFSQKFEPFATRDILQDGTWVVTDKTVCYGDEWFEIYKEYAQKKIDAGKDMMVKLPFFDRDGVNQLEMIVPTFNELDSLSEFSTKADAKMQDENELGTAGGNTIHMRQGLAKTRFMMEAPVIAGASNSYIIMTAQLGKEIQMATGPYAPLPTKKLQHMKMGDKVKGVSDKFFFLLSNTWQTVSASLLLTKDKLPEYPKNKEDDAVKDPDLNAVTITLLRSKSAQSGTVLELVVSQSEGVLPALTEYHHIKNSEYFGIGGNKINFFLDMYPDVKLSRPTIRGKIDSDPKLRRALNITSELCQMHSHYRYLEDLLITPKELYTALVEKGYDVDWLLSNTRGWWTINNDDHPLYFLSTLDLLKMAKGTYTPYWLENDLKTVKPMYNKTT